MKPVGGPITICAMGDLMLGDSAKCIGFGVRSVSARSGIAPFFRKVAPHLAGDIVFANLECVCSDHDFSPLSFDKAQMRSLPEAAVTLREIGFSVVSVANNHCMQHGETGFRDTCAALDAAGLRVVGRRGIGRYRCEPCFIERRGQVVAMLGYGLSRENYCREPLYARGDAGEMAADVARLRAEADNVLVSLHWGEEFMPVPAQAMVALGRSLVDAGACLVLGHHPHVLQPMERYRDGLICYSLGNFLSDMLWAETLRRGALVSVELDRGATLKSALVVRTEDDYTLAPVGPWQPDPEAMRKLPAEAAYRHEVEALRVRNRNLSHLYVLRNLYRYHPVVLGQIALHSLRSAIRG